MKIKPITREERERNWSRDQVEKKEIEPTPAPLNLEAILDFGSSVSFTFRGKPYGVPPLPWREGEVIMGTVLKLQSFGKLIHKDNIDAYYATFRELQTALWRNTRCVGRIQRTLRILGLVRNPFRQATEGETTRLAHFMLGRRMTSSGLLTRASLNLET